MHSRRIAQAIQSEEVDEMNMEERVGKLEVKVDHIQSDLTEVKTDLREVRSDVKKVVAEMHTLGKDLRAEMQAQGKELRTEMQAQGTEIHALKISLEKFKGQIWVALSVLLVMQLLTMGGVPAAIARAFKFP
jgi:chromosome segregation ATPase